MNSFELFVPQNRIKGAREGMEGSKDLEGSVNRGEGFLKENKGFDGRDGRK